MGQGQGRRVPGERVATLHGPPLLLPCRRASVMPAGAFLSFLAKDEALTPPFALQSKHGGATLVFVRCAAFGSSSCPKAIGLLLSLNSASRKQLCVQRRTCYNWSD